MFKVQLFVEGATHQNLDGEFASLVKAVGAAETAAEKPDGKVTSYRIIGEAGFELQVPVTHGQRRFPHTNESSPEASVGVLGGG